MLPLTDTDWKERKMLKMIAEEIKYTMCGPKNAMRVVRLLNG